MSESELPHGTLQDSISSMLESIRVSMVRLQEEVSDMDEMLESLSAKFLQETNR